MKAQSQLVIATRILNTYSDFSGRLTLITSSGEAHLYCRNHQILLAELPDQFPYSWLKEQKMEDHADAIKKASSGEDKIKGLIPVLEKPEKAMALFYETKKRLKELLSAELKKCELKPEPLIDSRGIMTVGDMFFECAPDLLKNIYADELMNNDSMQFQLSPDFQEKAHRIQLGPQEGYLLSRLDQPIKLKELYATVPWGEEEVKRGVLILWAFGVTNSPALGQLLPKSGLSGSKEIINAQGRTFEQEFHLVNETYDGLSRKDYYALLGVSGSSRIPDL